MPISLTHSSRYRTLDFSSDRPGIDLDCGISQSSEKAEEVTSKLHRILRPFLLRRCVCVCTPPCRRWPADAHAVHDQAQGGRGEGAPTQDGDQHVHSHDEVRRPPPWMSPSSFSRPAPQDWVAMVGQHAAGANQQYSNSLG
jgi:hypothetical protein